VQFQFAIACLLVDKKFTDDDGEHAASEVGLIKYINKGDKCRCDIKMANRWHDRGSFSRIAQ